MLVKSIMTTDIEWLTLDSNTKDAENQAFELNTFHLPVTSQNSNLGLLPFDILSSDDIDKRLTIENFKDDIIKVAINEDEYVFDVFKNFAKLKLSSLPVINTKGNTVGLLMQSNVIEYLSNTLSAANPGSFITLKLGTNDYNLQEIARIVESNNARILSLNFEPSYKVSDAFLCTIKINTKDLKHILATFDRFEYEYEAHSSITEQDTQLQDRYELLMKYLNI